MVKNINNNVKNMYFALLKTVSLRSGMDRDHIWMGKSYGRNNLLLGWDDAPFLAAAQAICKAYPAVSENAVLDELQHSILNLFEQNHISEDADPEIDALDIENLLNALEVDQIVVELERLLTEIKSNVRDWSAFIFIEGLELSTQQFQFAGATIYPNDKGPLWSLLSDNLSEKLQARITIQLNKITEQCRCYMVVNTHGDSEYARGEAARSAQRILAILTLYMANLGHRQALYRNIGMVGYSRDDRLKFILMFAPPVNEAAEKRLWSYESKHSGIRYHNIETTELVNWQHNGLEAVVDSCNTDCKSRSPAATRINNAVTWYCRAMNAITVDEQFVALVTTLESLLVADESVSIKQRLADSVAMLLGRNFTDRERLRVLTAELYKIRCNIVHQGSPCSLENLMLLNQIVVAVILEFARRETNCWIG